MIRQKILIPARVQAWARALGPRVRGQGSRPGPMARTERLMPSKPKLTQRHPGITVAVAELDVNDHDQVPTVFVSCRTRSAASTG